MAVPEVDRRLLGELEEMGFLLAPATRALHFSGNSTLDVAVNWLFEHENDTDIDQMPLVPLDINIESLDSSQVSEIVNLKVVELSNRTSRRKEHQGKTVGMEREKERRRAGKELLEVKRIQEETERRRFIKKREAEEEQLKRDRDRIRQKLQQDKEDRRRRLGLPVEDHPSVKHNSPSLLEKKESFPVESAISPVSATDTELMRDCLRSLKRNHKEDGVKLRSAFQTLMIYVKNVVKNPDEEKYRKIRLGNSVFQDRVGRMEEGVRFLELCGFERDEAGKFLFLPVEKLDKATLVSAGSVLNSAITNPFFGLLSK